MPQYKMWKDTYPNMPVLDISRCETMPVSHKMIRPILLNDHYLHRDCQCLLRVGMFVDHILAGICCYGTTIATVSDAVCGKEYRYNVLDLNRLYIYDWAGKNSESWLIGQSFKWLKKIYPDRFILVSYASINHGHIGTVYQATNWLYTGKSAIGGLRFWIDGVEKTARAVMARYGTVSLPILKEKFGDRIKWDKTEPKNRYVYFLKKKMAKKLKYSVLPYPKMEQVNEDQNNSKGN